MAKKKKEVPKEETPAQRFKRVIQPRVGKALKAIRLVGSVTGTAYQYTDDDASAVMAALKEAVDKVALRFEGQTDASDGFTL